MSKEQFLAELERQLHRLDKTEQQDVLEYYREYFDDAGPENEQRVIEELGSPKEIAKTIKAQSAFNQAEADPKNTKKSIRAVWIGIGAFFATPVALPLAIVAAVLVVVLLVVLIVLLIAFYAVALSLALAAVIALIMSVVVLFASPAAALMTFGTALVLIALAGLFFIPTLQFSRWSFRKLAEGINRVTHRKKQPAQNV